MTSNSPNLRSGGSGAVIAALALLLIAAGLALIVLGQAHPAATVTGISSTPERSVAIPVTSSASDTATAVVGAATTDSELVTPLPAASPVLTVTLPAPASPVEPFALATYCLWPNDTASLIAANAGISEAELLAANPAWNGQAGSTIRLPAGSIPPWEWTAPLPAVSGLSDLPFGVSGYYLGRNNRQRQVALSFDVGYAEGNLERMQMLKQRGIRATFFVLGGALVKHPDIIGQILDNGHELGNHSFTHDNMLDMAPGIVAWELQVTEQLTAEARAGASTKPLFRAPFGAINDQVVAVAEREGYHVIGWTVDSRDWTEQISAEELYQRVVSHVCPGAIIAFHDVNEANGPALPRLLDYLDRNGYRYVTVSQILAP